MQSLAGAAAWVMQRVLRFLPRAGTPPMGAAPELTIEPIAFSTMLLRPPALLPGVVLALGSTLPRCR
jgi:hypothetical protein